MGECVKAKLASFVLLGSVTLGAAPAYADASGDTDGTTTSVQTSTVDSTTDAGGDAGQLFFASDEQYVQTFGAAKATQQGRTTRTRPSPRPTPIPAKVTRRQTMMPRVTTGAW